MTPSSTRLFNTHDPAEYFTNYNIQNRPTDFNILVSASGSTQQLCVRLCTNTITQQTQTTSTKDDTSNGSLIIADPNIPKPMHIPKPSG
jgi:hypothetical protein